METWTEEILEEITTTAKANGALLVGTTKIRRKEPVILFAFPFSEKWFFSYPVTLTKWLGKDYLTSKHVQNLAARILHQAGYRAEYKTILSVFGDFRPLAVAAGLGQWGRNGLVVNKEYGSGLLYAALFTDPAFEIAESITPEMPVTHCADCGHCTGACPGKAFADGRFNYLKCVPYSLRGCAECVKACRGNGHLS